MTTFFSPSTCFFYDDQLSTPIPGDAVEFSAEARDALLVAAGAQGKHIGVDPDGCPVLADPPPPTPEALAAIERHWRDGRLLATDGVVARHRDEQEGSAATTLTSEQYSALQVYRQALRNWPVAGEFPLIDHRPPPPLWLADQFQ